MKQATINTIITVVLILMAFAIAGNVYLLKEKIHQEQALSKQQLEFKKLGRFFRKASDKMTKEARQFAMTTKIVHFENYWAEVLKNKNRDEVIQQLKKLNAPEEAFNLINEAKQKSDRLIKTEVRSMRLVIAAVYPFLSTIPESFSVWQLSAEDAALSADEKLKLAREILYNYEYEKAKERIIKPLVKFQKITDKYSISISTNAERQTNNFLIFLIILVFLLPIGLSLILWFFHVTFSVPISNYIKALQERDSHISEALLQPAGTYELRLLAHAFNKQIETNHQQIEENKTLIEEMRLASADLENIDWLKTGQNQLNEHMSGEQSLMTLAKNVIHFLSDYLDAKIGLFYVLNQEDIDKSCLNLLASHAFNQRKKLSNTYNLGEGLVGQVGLEKKMILVNEMSEDYIAIQAELGTTIPKNIIAIPFLHENHLKGVIQFAFDHELTDVQIDFLEQVMPSIGIAVNSTEIRANIR